MGHGGGAAAAARARQASQNDRKTSAVGFEPGPLRKEDFEADALTARPKCRLAVALGLDPVGIWVATGTRIAPKPFPK